MNIYTFFCATNYLHSGWVLCFLSLSLTNYWWRIMTSRYGCPVQFRWDEMGSASAIWTLPGGGCRSVDGVVVVESVSDQPQRQLVAHTSRLLVARSPVLEPDLDGARRQTQPVGQLTPTIVADVPVATEVEVVDGLGRGFCVYLSFTKSTVEETNKQTNNWTDKQTDNQQET